MFEEYINSLNVVDFGVSITEGLAGNIVAAGIIAPLLGYLILKWRRARWRKFREYLAHLVEQNHSELCKSQKETALYLENLSEFEPKEVIDIDEVEFSQHRHMLSDALARMEDVGAKFHFAMEPDMLEAWAKYHAEAWSLLRDPNQLAWQNTEGIVSAVKRGYDGFDRNPTMYDDVFSTPMELAASKIAKIDTETLAKRKDEFIAVLKRP
ncbi:MAG: hypothetical protein AAFX39_13300 [Pseudomonadota bacterium]